MSTSGLVFCFTEQWSAFCSEKSVQFTISASLVILFFFQICLKLARQGLQLKLSLLIEILIISSLINNLLHCLYYQRMLYFFIETLFFDFYFATILLYVLLKYIKNQQKEKRQRSLLFAKITYAFFISLYFTAFVISMFLNKKRCNQIWYLSIRIVGVVISLGLFIMGKLNQNSESEKIQRYKNVKKIRNPLKVLWTWIGFNIFSQLANIISSIIFILIPSCNCMYFPNNPNINYVIDGIMVLITYQLPFMWSLYIFWIPIAESPKVSQTEDPYAEDEYKGIQIIPKQSFSFREDKTSSLMS